VSSKNSDELVGGDVLDSSSHLYKERRYVHNEKESMRR
jgi:hypothetical protein